MRVGGSRRRRASELLRPAGRVLAAVLACAFLVYASPAEADTPSPSPSPTPSPTATPTAAPTPAPTTSPTPAPPPSAAPSPTPLAYPSDPIGFMDAPAANATVFSVALLVSGW